MRNLRTTVLLLLLATSAAFGAPARKMAVKQVSTFTGQCTHLALANRLIEVPCSEQAFRTVSPDGRVTFAFSADQQFTLEFSGDSKRKQALGNLGIMQPIDHVAFAMFTTSAAGQPQRMKASGKCTYGDAFAGDPIRIMCGGNTPKGKFEITFETNGGEPG